MKKVYLVEGRTGEHGAAITWPVCIYELEDKAKQKVKELNEWLKSFEAFKEDVKPNQYSVNLYRFTKEDFLSKINKDKRRDPNIRLKCNGVIYYYYSTDFIEE